MEAPRKTHIVVAGAGFGGLQAYQTLQKHLTKHDQVEITLVNRGDTFVFIPMIHEVAAGLLQPSTIIQPLRLLSKRFLRDFIDGTIKEIDFDARRVLVERAEGFTDNITYDYLILGLGSVVNFFGIPGAQEHALPLRTLSDARRLKNHVLAMFDKADTAYDTGIQKDLIRFVLVGGGATGIELAGELSDLISGEMTQAFPHLAPHGEIVLIERGERLISEAHPKTAHRAQNLLEGWKCVQVRTGTAVARVTENGVETNRGAIASKTVIWSGGVQAYDMTLAAAKPLGRDEKTRRISVSSLLSIPVYPEVYVVGDQALIPNLKTGKPYGMRAQHATEEGRHAARNILLRIRGYAQEAFLYRERGTILSLGRGGALADIWGMRFSGFLARVIYRAAYLKAIVGTRAKLRTALEWCLNFFTPRDISKI